MVAGILLPYIVAGREKKLNEQFCWNCYNFEDRRDIDGVALCAKGHTPGTYCEDFIARDEKLREVDVKKIRLIERFCWNCYNFEDRRDIDGSLICAKGYSLEGNCEDFIDINQKLRGISNNNRHERVVIKAILIENKNPTKFSYSLQNIITDWKNSKQKKRKNKVKENRLNSPLYSFMDEMDIRILRELVNDARLSYEELARRTGATINEVKTRIHSLEKQGVIKAYNTILDTKKVGYDVAAIIEIVISKDKLLDVEKEIVKNPNVCAVYNVTGARDVIVIARFKNRKELSEFVKSLLSSEFVERTITHVARETVKEDFKVHI